MQTTKSKVYLVDQLGNDNPVEYTEEQILNEYWETWRSRMDKKYGPEHHLTTERNCVTDWLVTHWAWEKSE